jgi:bifunctional UDP-N-acetylglucosamine pyrophosphorylase/glucosamine-1-phosphate N-acetyltransferase
MATRLHFVILAAGKGTRMKSDLPKVLHQVGGEPMLAAALRTASSFSPATTTVVIGHMAEKVAGFVNHFPGTSTVIQEPQLGTGHALLQAEPKLAGQSGTLVLLYGDVPLLSRATVSRLVTQHQATDAAATVLTAHLPNPVGLGRIVRERGQLVRIVEERDATPAERALTEFNSGIYAFSLAGLFDALKRIGTANDQGEYYLPDLIDIFRRDQRPVQALTLEDASELRGVNSRAELAEMSAMLRDARNAAAMDAGVTIVDPATTWLGPEVEIGRDTIVYPNVTLEGRTRIGARCEIRGGVRIADSTIADDVVVLDSCLIRQSTIASGATLGPFAQLRPESRVEAGAHVGNFVELKKTTLGPGSKANHLAYLGDATIGAKVNIGAGVITCNYDGEKKHPTVIEDGAFIGTDSQLVAPVRVGADAYVAAGSSITRDVPPGALGIARSRQENKPGWAEKRRAIKVAK